LLETALEYPEIHAIKKHQFNKRFSFRLQISSKEDVPGDFWNKESNLLGKLKI
jgi:hypothetical protein